MYIELPCVLSLSKLSPQFPFEQNVVRPRVMARVYPHIKPIVADAQNPSSYIVSSM